MNSIWRQHLVRPGGSLIPGQILVRFSYFDVSPPSLCRASVRTASLHRWENRYRWSTESISANRVVMFTHSRSKCAEATLFTFPMHLGPKYRNSCRSLG